MPRTKSEIDRRVGMRLRERRILANLSQTEIGNVIGVTFQQVQKYELGANRLSAGRLLEIAEALNVPVSYFFYGEEPPSREPSPVAPKLSSTPLSADALRFAAALDLIRNDKIRKGILNLTRELAARTEG